MSFLEHKIPPPVVALVFGTAMWFLAKWTTPLDVPVGFRTVLAILIGAAGLGVMVAGVFSFSRAKTTVNPLKPDAATALVTGGIYRYTRNPMYLGMLLVLLGWCVFLDSPLAPIGAVGFWLYIDHFQIRPEEKALTALFGGAFTDYMSQVRRWL